MHMSVAPDQCSQVGIAVSKASVALFLLRIVLRKWHIALLWSVIVSTSIFSIITTTLLFLQCKPVSFLWNPTIPGGHCPINFTDVGISMGGTYFCPVND